MIGNTEDITNDKKNNSIIQSEDLNIESSTPNLSFLVQLDNVDKKNRKLEQLILSKKNSLLEKLTEEPIIPINDIIEAKAVVSDIKQSIPLSEESNIKIVNLELNNDNKKRENMNII